MEIKARHKQTEIGVIPEDWDVRLAAQICELVVDCKNRTPPIVNSGEYAVVRTPNVRAGKFVREELRFTDERSFHEWTARAVPKPNDVLITREAPLGEVCLAPSDLKFCLGQRMMLYRPDQAMVDSRFFLYALMSSGVMRNLLMKIGGSTVGHARVDDIRELQVPVPPTKAEQEAIAESLSDADALIDSLEQLIAKKRNIKQGVVQELLTGKRRLPGFSGEWSILRLEDIADIDVDNLGSGTPPDYTFNYISLEDVDSGSLRGYSEQVFHLAPSRARRKLRFGDILVGTVRPNLQSHLLFDSTQQNWICSTGFSVIRCRKQCAIPEYIFAHLFGSFVGKQIDTLLTGSNYPAINGKDVKALEIPLPSLSEQEAIAAILSDMEREISSLEAKLAKARAIKQGMMQELLTGRIRLLATTSQVAPVRFETKSHPATTKPHNWAINEAVVIGVLTTRYGSQERPLTRKRYTKFSYLLHRRAEGKAEGYRKKAAGPYNPDTRYRGPESIAKRNRYIRPHDNGKYSGFIAADKIEQAEGYFQKWYGDGVLAWLDQFRRSTTDELELLTTVDMAMVELRGEAKPVNLEAVKQIIRDDPEWNAKLDRPIFSDDNISRAIRRCEELFATEETIA